MSLILVFLPLHLSGCPFAVGAVRSLPAVPAPWLAPEWIMPRHCLDKGGKKCRQKGPKEVSSQALLFLRHQEKSTWSRLLRGLWHGCWLALRRNFYHPLSHSPPRAQKAALWGMSSDISGQGQRVWMWYLYAKCKPKLILAVIKNIKHLFQEKKKATAGRHRFR